MSQAIAPVSFTNLYEQDFQLWLEQTLVQLQARDTEHLDWANLIEEVADLGRSQKRELESRLRVLLAHILKRRYVNSPSDYRGWLNTIDEQSSELELLLASSPSLGGQFLQIFDKSFIYALLKVRRDYPDVIFPAQWQFSRDPQAILTTEFWQS
jgi:predicted DNA-binding ribbon-helix-helix protein